VLGEVICEETAEMTAMRVVQGGLEPKVEVSFRARG
jgi:hypothetical protein